MKATFILVFSLMTFNLFAQSAIVSGEVVSKTSKSPVDLATIVLRSNEDSTKVYGTKSNERGVFVLKNVPFGKYIIKISSLGFVSKDLKGIVINSAEKTLEKVLLEDNKRNLKDVIVLGEKATIQMTAEKKIFNVEKNITSAGGTAEDVLRNTPSVSVDMDGGVSLRGKDNVTFLVDGKPSAMFGSDMQTALQSIPAASIESIEVITNPSAKYDAQGSTGIINIVLRKDRKPGYNGMINLGLGYPYRLNGGINLNANIKKWNLFFNANGRTSRTWEETTSNRDNYENDFTFSSFTHNDRKPLSGNTNFGFEYQMDKENKLSFTQSFFNANMKGNSVNTIKNELNYFDLLSRQIRENEYTGKPLNSTSNVQYVHKFKKPKEELNAEANFSISRYIRESEIRNNDFDGSNNVLNSYVLRIPIRGGNYNGTFQVDYTKPIFKNARIDFGAKSYFIQFKSENQPTKQIMGEAEYAEPFLKNHFVFNQQQHAVYTNVANQFNKTSIQIGLRAEYFKYNGTVYQYNQSAENDYLSLFPTLFVSQKLNDHNDLTLNYSRRVNRPNFFQLIPYIDVTNPQDTSMGNPFLRPEFIHSIEAGYNYRYGKSNSLIASIYYQYTNNLIQRYRRFNSNGTTFSQNQNLASAQTYGIELIDKHNFTPNWDLTSTFNGFVNKIDGSNVDQTLKRNGFGGFVKFISNNKLSKTWSLQTVANLYGQTLISQGYVKPYGNLDFGLKKTFYNNLINVSLNVNDVFNTIQTESVYNFFPIYNQTVLRKNLTRTIGLNLQIRFASKSLRSGDTKVGDSFKKTNSKAKGKEKEAKSRDENLKKDEGDGEEGGGNNR